MTKLQCLENTLKQWEWGVETGKWKGDYFKENNKIEVTNSCYCASTQ